ncbi:MAG TPA: hydroxymethylbilane synthase [Phototrophicaceae bacterium]|nr:hydroxymethylbilane synthase [Phototrophicaceae bacterium]
MIPPVLRLGTRASTLALTQSTTVADALAEVTGREVELVRIRTEGDRNRASLATLGGTGVFAAALREALLAGECDLAVHSLKDLPTAPVPGLSIGAIPPRADSRDVLCAREGWTLATLPAGARVGTGSPRRAAQLLAARPDLDIVDIRGNVETRLGRVQPGDLDAVVLARAGLARVDRLAAVTDTLDPEVVVPAPGQGALAVECRTEDLADPGHPLSAGLRALDDHATRLAVTAERVVLRVLEAGCAAPLGALARVEDGTLHLHATVVEHDGSRRLTHRATATVATDDAAQALTDAEALGTEVAEALLAAGAADITGRPA